MHKVVATVNTTRKVFFAKSAAKATAAARSWVDSELFSNFVISAYSINHIHRGESLWSIAAGIGIHTWGDVPHWWEFDYWNQLIDNGSTAGREKAAITKRESVILSFANFMAAA